jgi:glycosyltransferase involved in cell wall biosynthesis
MTMISSDIAIRRVLVIAYYFPPMGLSGVQRTLKFVKYFPQYGWQPTVLTVEPRGYIAKDASLLQELNPEEVRIVRTGAAGPGKLVSKKEVVALPHERMRKFLSRVSDTIFVPDNKIGWKNTAIDRGAELHRDTPFDLIFATAPPFTSFLVGEGLKARINVPLVLDYRDPWVDYPFKFYPTPIHRAMNVALERKALRASSHVVTTNRRVKEILLDRYRFLTYHDVDIVPQGFDPEDFEVVRENFQTNAGGGRSSPRLKKMRVTYAGIFWEDRIPDHYLQALHELFKEQPRLRGRIESVFIGTFRKENRRIVDRLGLQDVVTIYDYLPHRECVRELLQSDVLWMILGDDLGTPGKVYEYIGARKAILGCVPEGYMRSTIQEANGKVVNPDDVQGIKKALSEFYDLFERHLLPVPPDEVVQKHNRSALTRSLVKVFESLIET